MLPVQRWALSEVFPPHAMQIDVMGVINQGLQATQGIHFGGACARGNHFLCRCMCWLRCWPAWQVAFVPTFNGLPRCVGAPAGSRSEAIWLTLLLPAGPLNQVKDASTAAPAGQGFCDTYHTFRMDWQLNTITSERGMRVPQQCCCCCGCSTGAPTHCCPCCHQAMEHRLPCMAHVHQANPALPPLWLSSPAVYIDGAQTAQFNSAARDAGGWFAAAAGAPASAPFDIPFSLIM